eukprot:m.245495 g.245495  ORF g.245495 m.245495 type:complete len:100 (-) comp33837_c3_seq18:5379-5678(-)
MNNSRLCKSLVKHQRIAFTNPETRCAFLQSINSYSFSTPTCEPQTLGSINRGVLPTTRTSCNAVFVAPLPPHSSLYVPGCKRRTPSLPTTPSDVAVDAK